MRQNVNIPNYLSQGTSMTNQTMINKIVKNHKEHQKNIEWIKSNIDFLSKNSNWKEFIICMAQLNPQSYGNAIQKRLIEELGLTKIKASEDKGDFIDKFGDHYELKVSLIQNSKQKMNLVQIRPWQKTRYYFIAFCIKDEDVHAFCFSLSHERMKKELKITNASAAHGTKKSTKKNKNVEYRLSIPIDSNNATFSRWFSKYRSNFLDDNPHIKTLKTIEDVKKVFK